MTDFKRVTLRKFELSGDNKTLTIAADMTDEPFYIVDQLQNLLAGGAKLQLKSHSRGMGTSVLEIAIRKKK